jgi:hypothetical protein
MEGIMFQRVPVQSHIYGVYLNEHIVSGIIEMENKSYTGTPSFLVKLDKPISVRDRQIDHVVLAVSDIISVVAIK